VLASAPNFKLSPLMVTEPVNRLHEPFPATRPASGNARLAFEFAITGVPARSASIHSVPTSENGAADTAAFVGFLSPEGQPAVQRTTTTNNAQSDFTGTSRRVSRNYAVFFLVSNRYTNSSRIAPTTDMMNPADCPS